MEKNSNKDLDNTNNDSTKEPLKIEDDRQTSVYLYNRSTIKIIVLAFIAPLLGFLIANNQIPPIFTLALVGLIVVLQAIPLNKVPKIGFSETSIKLNRLTRYTDSEKKLYSRLKLLFGSVSTLNVISAGLFYLLFLREWMENHPNILHLQASGYILVMGLFAVLYLVMIRNINKPNIMVNYELFKKEGISFEEKAEMERKAKEEEELREAQFNLLHFGEGYVSLGYRITINEKDLTFFIGLKKYQFKDILSFDVRDKAVTIHSASTSTAKTNGGDMLGRAVVGGLLFGEAGAIVGGATASKSIVHSASQTSVVHDYSVVITVDGISSPYETIHIGTDEPALNKIVSTLTVILKRNSLN